MVQRCFARSSICFLLCFFCLYVSNWSFLYAGGQTICFVVIDAMGLGVEQIAFTLKHAPFLGQRFLYQLTLTVKGERALLDHPVSAQHDQLVDFDETSILKPV